MLLKTLITCNNKWVAGAILLIASIACRVSGRYLENNGLFRDYDRITAIEDRSSEPHGFMVMTADYSYAIYSPRLAVIGWESVTMNGAQVFIVTKAKKTLVTGLFSLDEHERDLIAEIRSDFMQNLAGLQLTHMTASSLFLSSKHRQQAYAPSHMTTGESSQAAANINALQGVTYLSGYSGSQPDSRHNYNYEYKDHQPGQAMIRLDEEEEKEEGARATEAQPSTGGERNATQTGRSLASQQRSYNHQHYSYVPAADTHNNHRQHHHHRQHGAHYTAGKRCSRKYSTGFNYYNLHDSPLTKSLSGDIYNFDLHCNILDVYSDSVSVAQRAAVLYRNDNYFTHASPDLPLQINRFFLADDKVFFVYNDGSILLKQNWLLEPIELDVVIAARRRLRAVSSWHTAAELEVSPSSTPGEGSASGESGGDSEQVAQREPPSNDGNGGANVERGAKKGSVVELAEGSGVGNQTARDKQ